ncbi:hypothetical protein COCNU_scaffold022222G000010 [Cocos nucifera]|nr:hypothetical protein [Cocos nucifera]
MPWTTEVINDNGDLIKVGTTGTIGSLMSRELEPMKQSSQASSSSRRRPQTGPVTVPCGASPKKTLQRKNPPNESGSSSSNGTDHRTPGYGHKPRHKPRKNGHRVPMLGSDNIPIDRNPNTENVEKKGQSYTVEIVDLKCSNPMSSRLKKLGFSKLSESIA